MAGIYHPAGFVLLFSPDAFPAPPGIFALHLVQNKESNSGWKQVAPEIDPTTCISTIGCHVRSDGGFPAFLGLQDPFPTQYPVFGGLLGQYDGYGFI
jgi:hypothetical protein